MTFRQDYRDGATGCVVRHELAADKYVVSDPPGRGNVLPFKLPGRYEEATMSYDVRFAAPFDFSAGGKLPGFVGVAPGTSPGTPTGGGSVEHGFSARIMWLGAKMWKAVRDSKRPNGVVTYLYHPGQVREFGDNVFWPGCWFIGGRYHRVTQYHRLNTVGQADGVLRTWFDDQLVLDQTDVVYRTDPAVQISHFDWSVFRGGSSMDWTAPVTNYVDIDNVLLTTP